MREAVFHAAPEIDGRRLLEILRRAAHLANRETVPQNLRQHLVVERESSEFFDQVPRVRLARERPVARVVFRQLRAEQDIFRRRQKPVGHVFPHRHSAAQRVAAQNAAAQHARMQAIVATMDAIAGDQLGRVYSTRPRPFRSP